MSTLHEENEDQKYIYDAIVNTGDGPKYTWDPNLKLYIYSNSKFPNKNYKKTFDPISLGLSRGDVVHFGNDSYRNNDKLIFDGEKLIELWTDADDYGSVPPNFVCGDEPGDFDIGDFEDSIDHNTINWLSKQKLKEIELYIKNDKVYGKVTIQGKEWKICIDIHDDDTFSKLIPSWDVDLTSMAEPMKSHFRKLGLAQLVYYYGGMVVPDSFCCIKNLTDLYKDGTSGKCPFFCEAVNRTVNILNQKRIIDSEKN
jgi:hypothetical protein